MFHRCTVAAIILSFLLPAAARAQQSSSKAEKYALLLTSIVALMPLDAAISNELAEPAHQQNQVFHTTASVFNTLGQPGVVVLAVGTLGAGLASGSPELTDMGLHTTEAIAASGIVTWLVKGLAGRLRPNASPDDSDEYTLAGGFNGRGGSSMPSGHATAAFAFAAATAEEVKLHYPDAAKYVTPAVYGAATLVGLSRIYSQKHWTSDVVIGAAIGAITAQQLVKLYHHD